MEREKWSELCTWVRSILNDLCDHDLSKEEVYEMFKTELKKHIELTND